MPSDLPAVKEQLRRMLDAMHEDITWDDVLAEVEFRRKIHRGLMDIDAGRVVRNEDLMRMLSEALSRPAGRGMAPLEPAE
jgi:hypothetical protein